MEQIGRIVRFHRKKAGLTQVDLARLAGVGKTTVFDIEKGKPNVGFDKVLSILDVLNIRTRFEGPLMEEYEKIESTRAR